MKNNSLLFRLSTIIMLSLDIVVMLFFLLSVILAFTGVWFLGQFHLILFIVIIVLNVLYAGYCLVALIRNRSKK